MQKTDGSAKPTQRTIGSSTTLNRKYVKRPVARKNNATNIARSSSIRHFRNESMVKSIPVKTVEPQQQTETIERHPLQVSAVDRMQKLRSQQSTPNDQGTNKMTAREIKNQAIQKALKSATIMKQEDASKQAKKTSKLHFGFGRIALALSCAALVALVIVYFVNLNMPDISLRVAAMQTGINASYPSYIPRGYTVSSITSENKKIVLDFKSTEDEGAFTLTEETSSWDSNALLNNYAKPTYGDNFKVIKEQGLTIYISGSNAVWVNGGLFYKIDTQNGTLTNKQICTIATSL